MTSAQFIRHRDSAPRPINALVLDDSAFDRQRIRRMATRTDLPIHFEEAPSLSAMAERLDREVFDLVLIDYRLSEGDGFSALDMVRAHDRNSQAARIMVSGNTQVDVAVSAFRHGCHDYLRKQDLDHEVLGSAIRNALQLRRPPPPPAPADMDPASLQQFLVQALQSEEVLNTLRPALVDSLRSAIGGIGREKRLAQFKPLQSFMREFTASDDFAFRFNASPARRDN